MSSVSGNSMNSGSDATVRPQKEVQDSQDANNTDPPDFDSTRPPWSPYSKESLAYRPKPAKPTDWIDIEVQRLGSAVCPTWAITIGIYSSDVGKRRRAEEIVRQISQLVADWRGRVGQISCDQQKDERTVCEALRRGVRETYASTKPGGDMKKLDSGFEVHSRPVPMTARTPITSNPYSDAAPPAADANLTTLSSQYSRSGADRLPESTATFKSLQKRRKEYVTAYNDTKTITSKKGREAARTKLRHDFARSTKVKSDGFDYSLFQANNRIHDTIKRIRQAAKAVSDDSSTIVAGSDSMPSTVTEGEQV